MRNRRVVDIFGIKLRQLIQMNKIFIQEQIKVWRMHSGRLSLYWTNQRLLKCTEHPTLISLEIFTKIRPGPVWKKTQKSFSALIPVAFMGHKELWLKTVCTPLPIKRQNACRFQWYVKQQMIVWHSEIMIVWWKILLCCIAKWNCDISTYMACTSQALKTHWFNEGYSANIDRDLKYPDSSFENTIMPIWLAELYSRWEVLLWP